MPRHEAATEPRYSIWIDGKVQTGTARELLEEIRRNAGSDEIRRMTTPQYAKILLDDAPFFLPADLLQYLGAQHYESDYDRALRYLSEMNTSGVRILKNSA